MDKLEQMVDESVNYGVRKFLKINLGIHLTNESQAFNIENHEKDKETKSAKNKRNCRKVFTRIQKGSYQAVLRQWIGI